MTKLQAEDRVDEAFLLINGLLDDYNDEEGTLSVLIWILGNSGFVFPDNGNHSHFSL